MLSRSPGLYLALGMTAVSVAAITAYAAATVTIDAAKPVHSIAGLQAPRVAEPQTSNRIIKADRVALLRDSASYTNFDAGVLSLDLSRAASRMKDASGANGLFGDGQIAGIQSRLQLTPQQAEYWPAVAVALQDIGRRYFPAGTGRRTRPPKLQMDSPEVLRLVEAARPLILQLTKDQKREVRELVRIIGLETVASQI